MLHEDHLGNRGELRSGGAQWMTAGRGIIHSEMPQQQSGRMHGFQLWINLPGREKMKPAAYRDLAPEEIGAATLPGGIDVRVIAGTLESDGQHVAGPIQGLSTQPLYFDVRLPAGTAFTHALPARHAAFAYVYEGTLRVGENAAVMLQSGDAGVLTEGEQVELHAIDGPARFLLLAAAPLNEPIAQYGPFVMNSREEIEQAIADYNAGTLATAA
jgi:redox-sensitive bicupin YhaK (pirin superfamily)